MRPSHPWWFRLSSLPRFAVAVEVGGPRIAIVDKRNAVADEDIVFNVTPSQTKVWLEILQRCPHVAFF